MDNPYAAPASKIATSPAKAWPRAPLWLMGGALVITVLSVIASSAVGSWAAVGFLGASMLGVAGIVRSILFAVKGPVVASVGGTVFAVVGNLFMTGMGVFLAIVSNMQFSRGRQLRSFGRVLLPPVNDAGDWTRVAPSGTAAPDAVAAQWRENGRTEHASVAAFARLTLDLMALGAPPALVRAANEDALDEIRHTELCFSLARSIDGAERSPGPFPEAQRARTLPKERTTALAHLAVDSLIDGALHEGVSARIIARLVKRCQVPAIRAVLKEIAADEGRHAAHGWDVVEWCLAEGGEPVRRALDGALMGLPETMTSPLPEGAKDGSWEAFGIHGHALEAEEYAKTTSAIRAKLAA
jgi:hypothetical protein